MNKIKFAVIGCGHIGKKHAEVISKNKDAELVALIDKKNPAELAIKNLHVPFFYSLKEFLEQHIDADVINIATPNGLHAQHAIDCINAGKHVVIEKPMALHSTAAKKIIDAANEKQKHVFVVMQNRYSAPVAVL
jgi:UDP-N-acetyl-2-amino-2-deoxyglucuronate dehydrogenase